MKILKVLLPIALAIVAVHSAAGFQQAGAATRGPKSSASVNFSQRDSACVPFLEKCTGRCLPLLHEDAFDNCMNRCTSANKLCKNFAWWWPGGARSAATGAIGEGGVKDPAAGNKLMAGGKGTRPGAATAAMPGAGARGSAVASGGMISTNGSAVTNSPVIIKRPAVGSGGGKVLSPPGTTTLKIQSDKRQ